MVNWENVGSSVNKHSANLIHVLSLKFWEKCQIIGGFWELSELAFNMYCLLRFYTEQFAEGENIIQNDWTFSFLLDWKELFSSLEWKYHYDSLKLILSSFRIFSHKSSRFSPKNGDLVLTEFAAWSTLLSVQPSTKYHFVRFCTSSRFRWKLY